MFPYTCLLSFIILLLCLPISSFASYKVVPNPQSCYVVVNVHKLSMDDLSVMRKLFKHYHYSWFDIYYHKNNDELIVFADELENRYQSRLNRQIICLSTVMPNHIDYIKTHIITKSSEYQTLINQTTQIFKHIKGYIEQLSNIYDLRDSFKKEHMLNDFKNIAKEINSVYNIDISLDSISPMMVDKTNNPFNLLRQFTQELYNLYPLASIHAMIEEISLLEHTYIKLDGK